ncbi:hypothetical protein K438DRAFT_753551 [Mycena galopus ATCC 62051]|nr:hypothetical protein K438DRAFT_753551 [Mycena galopus ATCC 62051]
MSVSPSAFCRGAVGRWDFFCSSARIFKSDNVNDLLLDPVTLPAKLPHFIEAALALSTENHPFSPHISQAELQTALKAGSFRAVQDDGMNFQGHMPHLCRLYNRFKQALARGSSEAAIRRAVDDLFELAFETDPSALVNSSYIQRSEIQQTSTTQWADLCSYI